jgi:catechol 2,3-dioxygenase-like lactoylglutathione lyase family enzyme
MRIDLTSILVDDQTKALAFYTEVLGFVTKADVRMGAARWLTVVAPDGPAEVQMLLEPNAHPAAKLFQKAIFEDGIPATSFASADVQQDYERLTERGVRFQSAPTRQGPVLIAVFDDTCGNWIQLHQVFQD